MIETITYHNVALGDPHGGVYAEGLSAEIKHDLYTGELVKLHIGKMAMSRIEAVAMFEADAIDHLENDKHEDWLDARSAAMTDWRAAENAETQGAE